jgi:hypothetical protein
MMKAEQIELKTAEGACLFDLQMVSDGVEERRGLSPSSPPKAGNPLFCNFAYIPSQP